MNRRTTRLSGLLLAMALCVLPSPARAEEALPDADSGAFYALDPVLPGMFLDAAAAALRARPEPHAQAAADIRFANVPPIPDQAYTGSPVTPGLTASYMGRALREGTDYALSYRNNTAYGSGEAVLTGMGSYTGTKTVSFAIARADISAASVTGVGSRSFSGYPVTQSPAVTLNGKALREGVDYQAWYQDNARPGTAYMILCGVGNYRGVRVVPFTISSSAGAGTGTTAPIAVSSSAGGRRTTIQAGGSLSFSFPDSGYYNSCSVLGPAPSKTAVASKSYSILNHNGISSMEPVALTAPGTYTVSYAISDSSTSLKNVNGRWQYVYEPSGAVQRYTQTVVVQPAPSIPAGSVTALGFENVVADGFSTLRLIPSVTTGYGTVDSTLRFTSSNPAAASVDAFGTVTIHAPGAARITARASNGLALFYDISPEDFSAVALPNVVSGASLSRDAGGYAFRLQTREGTLREGTDYQVRFQEDGDSVAAAATGLGNFTGTVRFSFPRPLLGLLTGQALEDGTALYELAPGAFTGSGRLLAAAFAPGGQLLDAAAVSLPDLSAGGAGTVRLRTDPAGTLKLFLLDAGTCAPLAEAPSGSAARPVTSGAGEGGSAGAPDPEAPRRVFRFLRDYALANGKDDGGGNTLAEIPGGSASVLFMPDSTGGSAWFVHNVVSVSGARYVNSLPVDNTGETPLATSSIPELGTNVSFDLDPASYTGDEPLPISTAFPSQGLGGDREGFREVFRPQFNTLLAALQDFLRSGGYSLRDLNFLVFKYT